MPDAVTFDNLPTDLAERLFYGGDDIVRRHDPLLRRHLVELLGQLTGDPVRRLLAAGKLALPIGTDFDPKAIEHIVYALTQFTGACDTILGGAHLVRGGYPHEAATLARRAFETGAAGLLYVDKPDAYAHMRATSHAPSMGKVTSHFLGRCRACGDPREMKRAYEALSNIAHSGPGVRLGVNFVDADRTRLGPLDATGAFAHFERGLHALSLATAIVGAMIAMAFEDEFKAVTQG